MSQTRILIVDDEATIRALLKCAVAAPQVELFEAACAEDALECAGSTAPFDLVITDILMPGMDGIDMASRLVTAGHAGKFLFISGYCDMDAVQDRIRDLRANFLQKPFSVPELIRIVREMLENRQSETNAGAPLRHNGSH